MLVIKLKTDHFSSRELHSNGLQKTMNPVLITQGPLPAPGKYFSSPSETPGENQGHCDIPGCPSLLSLSPAICGMHAHEDIQSQSTSPSTVMQSRKSHGLSSGGAGPGRLEVEVPFTQLSRPQSVQGLRAAKHQQAAHTQGGRAEEMHPSVHLLESPFTQDQAGE